MKKKYSFIIILFFILNNHSNSQEIPKLIQPTPEAANISRYADIPVSLFTGKPQIEFPLTTLKCGSLELPIFLSYYASGIKVEEYSTWLGIGWALNAGGVITKTVISSPFAIADLDYYLPLKGSSTEQFNTLVALDNRKTENDTYDFHFLNYSGSFQIKDNKPVFRKHVSLKVDFSSVNTIRVTDANGIKYYFDAKSSGQFQTDYYLVKIESADKLDAIYFEYISGDSYGKPPHNSVFYSLNPSVNYMRYSSENFESKHSGYLLSKVYTSNNDAVVFVKKDILQPKETSTNDTYRKALDSICVYNENKKLLSFHLKTNNVQTIKPYEPNVSYPFGYPAYKVNTEMNYRLYLDGFEKIDSAGAIIESYGFNYYGRTSTGKDSLPNRYSLAQDLEGYYNGQDNNTTLIPSFNQILHLNGEFGLHDWATVDNKINYSYHEANVNIPGANRNPDFQYMTLGTLKSIDYPTGGFAKFYFSQIENPLTLEPFFGIKVDKIEYLNSDGSLQKSKDYVYHNAVLGHHLPSNWRLTLHNGANMSPYPNFNHYWGFQYKDWDWALELSPDSAYDIRQNGAPMVGYGVVDEIEEGNGSKKYTFSIEGASYDEAKDYEFAVVGLFEHGFEPANVNITYKSWPTGPIMNKNWKLGTLLNETTYNQNQNLLAKKSYNYSYHVLDTVYGLRVHKVGKEYPTIFDEHNSFFYHQYSNFSIWERLDSITETIDGATKVTSYDYDERKQISQITTNGSNGDLLKTNFTYPYDYSSFVHLNMVARNMLAPVIEKIDSINNTQTKLVKTNYSFWKPEGSINTLASGNLVIEKGVNSSQTSTFNITEPAQLTINIDLWKNGDGYFFLEGYGPPKTFYASDLVETTLPPGNYTLTLSFPESTFPSSDFYGTANFSVQVKDIEYNMLTSNSITDYIYPLSVDVKKGGNLLETKLNYNSYDRKGNILSVSKTNDIEHIYIWGYKSQYPIAKIENATYSQVSSQIDNLQLKSDLDNDRKIDIINSTGTINYQGNEGALRLALANLRNSLSDALVTTYTYDPLIGVTSMTDPKGYTIYYEYDAFNRLKQVKDQYGKILSANEYHYKN